MTQNVLFEIGLEELPARFIDDAEAQLLSKTEKWLEELHVSYDSVTSFSTPRRLAVLITGVAEEQTTIKEEARGPAEKIAKDTDGNWSKAAVGFTKGQGKTTDDIYLKEIKGTNYTFVKNYIEGKPTIDLLPSFQSIIESIQFSNNMRWGAEAIRYVRPIRWLVGLYNDQVIPFEIAQVKSSNITYGHRFLGETISLKSPAEYEKRLRENFVIVDPKEREQLIVEGIKKMEKQEGFRIPAEQDLLDEVRNLVEFPTVFTGGYDPSFLQLPPEVLITSMKEHQRYFPVTSMDGKLLAHFVGVRNGDNHAIDKVIRGNEKVLHARLSDARFFYEEDQKQSIAFFQEKLQRVVFQEKLGTIHDKVKRIVHISKHLGQLLDVDASSLAKAVRTAEICKFDLTTNMVNEFTELQGMMGETYAIHFGEAKTVAAGIREHYLPDHANGVLPHSTVGALVSVADKLDTIVGCIAVGLTPTGSQDPYGLRRQAVGILRIMRDNNWDISLESIVDMTLELYKTIDVEQGEREKVKQALHDFFQLRATYLFREMAIEQDIIQAVLQREIGVFGYTAAKANLLSERRNDDQFKNVQEALVRVLNLSKKAVSTEVNAQLFETASEKTLFEQYQAVVKEYKAAKAKQKADLALLALSKLADPIHDFFENNMVLAEDKQVRNNRLAIVNNIAMLIQDFADLSVIEWKQHF